MRGADHLFGGVLPGLCVCLIVCDVETSTVRWPKPDLGSCAAEEKNATVTSAAFNWAPTHPPPHPPPLHHFSHVVLSLFSLISFFFSLFLNSFLLLILLIS